MSDFDKRLRQELEKRAKQIVDQTEQIEDLKRQLALRQQNSTTTSKPPSSDGLAGRQRVRGRRMKSRLKPGGQPGHPGHHRPLVPVERVNTILDLVPDACRHCGHRLHGRDGVGEPRRHQVAELPPIAAHITEFRCHRIGCPACGQMTQAALPDEIAGRFGPQLTALIAYLTAVCRLPRLVVQRLLDGVLQIPISVGSTRTPGKKLAQQSRGHTRNSRTRCRISACSTLTRRGIGPMGTSAGSGRWSRARSSSMRLRRPVARTYCTGCSVPRSRAD